MSCNSFVYTFEDNRTNEAHRSGWGFLFGMLPYGDAWRESRRIFTKYFSDSSINEPRDILYVRRFLGQLLQEPNDFLQHARTYVPFTIYFVNRS